MLKTTFSIDGIHIINSTSWAMEDLYKKVETIKGGHLPENKISKAGQVLKKPTREPTAAQPAAHPGYQLSATQWGTWPHDHSLVKPGRPLP